MNITQESTGDLTAIIQVTLQESDYIEEVNKQLSDYRKKATMPGFRPGKVPMGMIKKMYGNSVIVEEVNKKLSEALNNYIIENKINILGNPIPNAEKTSNIDFANNKEFDFFFDIGLAPELEVKLSKDIKVPLYSIKVTDKELADAIEDIKIRFGEDENPEKLEEGDAVQGKFTQVDEDGNLVEGGISNNGYLKYEDIKLKTIQKKFLNIEAGSTVVFNPMKTIKDESKVSQLLGIQNTEDERLNSDYSLEIEKIVRTHPAEIGEDLYKKVFPGKEIKDEEEFKKALSEDLSNHYQRDTERQFLGDTIKELIKIANVKLPDEFLKKWILESNEGKISEEQLEGQYASYAQTFKWQLLEAELLKDHKDEMEVKDDEVRAKVAGYFQTMGGNADLTPQLEGIIDQVLQNPEERQRIQNDLQDEKLIKLFKEHTSPKKKSVTKDKFIEIASKID